MPDERMPSKQYAKYEKVFFLFGSVSKMVSPVRPDEWHTLAEYMWQWAIQKVSILVDEYTLEVPIPVPESSETTPQLQPEPQAAQQAVVQAVIPPAHPDVLGETDTITVKAFTIQSKGVTKAGRDWKLYKVLDNHDISYYTFHDSFQAGKTYDVDWEWQERNGRKSRTIKTTPRPVETDEEEVPF